jgi:tellurite resistance protein TehA-like permease
VNLDDLGKVLIGFGLLIVLLGVVLLVAGRVPWLGRLPGDIYVRRGNWAFYFPLATSLVVSALLTLVFWILNRR